MKIAFVVNRIETEKITYTTIHLAFRAHRMGHQFHLIGADALTYTADGDVAGHGHTVPNKKYNSVENFLKDLQASEPEKVECRDLDILMLRNDPSDDQQERPWAQSAPYMFANIAMRHDTIVVNHPEKLSVAINKLYFQHFPEELRPKAIITRNEEEIWNFYRENKQRVILKPLQGSGGTNVFLAEKKTEKNLNQIIEAISRDGYIIAQEYLPAAKKGDIRLLLMNGEIMMAEGQPAIMQRLNKGKDIRSNISAGGSYEKAKMTPEIQRIAELLRPKLIQDGMFFIGVDIAGDKLIEINVYSAGGLPMMNELYGVSFETEMIKALEKKVAYKKDYDRFIDNLTLSTL
jgi:glutathione synthase